MSTDSRSKEPAARKVDLWALPEISRVETRYARYQEPKQRTVGRDQIVEYAEAVEFLVELRGHLPQRALSPALFIGDIPLIDFKVDAQGHLVFYSFDYERLPEGAPIAFGWPQFPENKRDTGFRYQKPQAK